MFPVIKMHTTVKGVCFYGKMQRRGRYRSPATKRRYLVQSHSIKGTGKRKYLYAKTKAELDKKYKEFAKHIATGTYTEIRKQTVEEYMLKPADHLQANRTETQILRHAGKHHSSSDYPLFQGNAVLFGDP